VLSFLVWQNLFRLLKGKKKTPFLLSKTSLAVFLQKKKKCNIKKKKKKKNGTFEKIRFHCGLVVNAPLATHVCNGPPHTMPRLQTDCAVQRHASFKAARSRGPTNDGLAANPIDKLKRSAPATTSPTATFGTSQGCAESLSEAPTINVLDSSNTPYPGGIRLLRTSLEKVYLSTPICNLQSS
jgi:hypothetical protein